MINVKVMKRTIILILLTLTCGSCYVKHTGTPAGYEIIEYPVENGIGTEYHPRDCCFAIIISGFYQRHTNRKRAPHFLRPVMGGGIGRRNSVLVGAGIATIS